MQRIVCGDWYRNWHQDIYLVLSTTKAGDVLSHISQRFISTKKGRQCSKFKFYNKNALYVKDTKEGRMT
jgi:hypothetical protein